MLSDSSLGAFRIVEVSRNAKFDSEVSAVSIAMRLYRIDNNLQWPPTLDALVPRYLPHIPVDPLSPTREPLRYVWSSDGKRPMIYSPGLDGIDQRGEFVVPLTPQYGWNDVSAKIDDQFRDLSRFEPPPDQASSQSAAPP